MITKNKLMLLGIVMFLSVLTVAIFAGSIAPHSYDGINTAQTLKPPQRGFLFGTDQYGRCIFSRVVHGSRIALRVGLIVVIIEGAIGITLGLLAGYYGGWIDRIVTFITDLTWSLPPIIMALAIVTMLGPSLNNVVISIAVVSWAQFARVVRAKTQAIKNLPYIEAAKSFGEKDTDILFRYILPNILSPIMVLTTLALPQAILSTTSLGFLGLGAQRPMPDWGLILSDGISYMDKAPWISVFPGIAIVFCVLGFNFLGEGLRELLEPGIKV